MSRNRISLGVWLAAVLGLCLVGGWLCVPHVAGGSMLRYGFTAGIVGDTNPTDAKAASLAWLRDVSKVTGCGWDFEANAFETANDAANALVSGRIDVAAMSSLEYLSVEPLLAGKAEPGLVFEFSHDTMLEYQLVARPDIVSLADLQGKRLAVPDRAVSADLPRLWLDAELNGAGLGDVTKTFVSVRLVQKRGQATMAVFFGQADAAIETRTAFDTAVELNPQIGKQVKVLARSPGLLSSVVVLRTGMEPAMRKQAIETATTFHDRPEYKQQFLVMRITRILPWNPRYLDTTRTLVERLRPVHKRTAK
jgi:ABC-type phosphate/phosphonate transport system substrate-binding protein